MKRKCVTCGKESEERKEFFELSGRVGYKFVCKNCAAEVGINNSFVAGFHSNTGILKKYVKMHPEAQFRLDYQLDLVRKNKEYWKRKSQEARKLSGCTKKKQTKCTCKSCGNTYYYGDHDVVKNIANVFHGSLYSINQVKDLGQCPKCGSRAISKREVFFWLDKKGNCVDVEE